MTKPVPTTGPHRSFYGRSDGQGLFLVLTVISLMNLLRYELGEYYFAPFLYYRRKNLLE